MEKAILYIYIFQILILTDRDVGSLEVLNTDRQHPGFRLYQLLLRKSFFGGLLLDLCNLLNEVGEKSLVFVISHSITNGMSTAVSRKEEPWTFSHF